MTKFVTFALCLLISASIVSARIDEAEFDAVDRVIVVGDVHGDFERFKEVLQSANLIDAKLRWTGGKTHLVQLGDIPDRGPDSRQIIDFLRRLERSAKRAGGQVHILIGNHDAMNMYGDLRYVVEGEYKAFSNRNSKYLLDSLYKAEVDWIKENTPEEEWPEFDDSYKIKWYKDRPLGYVEHRQSWSPDGEIGKWVRTKNAVVKIGDTLFVHGGISPEYADWSIKEINQAVRDSLENFDAVEESILTQEEGPLWYRGLANHEEEEEEEHLQTLLDNFDVKRIVIGHTPTPGVIVPRFGGRVIIADVGLSRYYGDHLACLEFEKNKAYAIHRGKRLPLPEDDEKSLINYLETISKLEPSNEAAQEWIQRLKSEVLKIEIDSE